MVSLVPSCAAALPVRPVLMSFWADQGPLRRGFPVPGSLDAAGTRQRNPAFRAQLNDVDVLAYAFLEVDAAGNVYFRNPAVDLSAQDLAGFCARHPADCPGDARAADGSFDAFTRLQNRTGTLRKIISVGGAHSQKTMDHVLAQPARFVRSVAALVSAYHLDGVDLDFEPNSFFFGDQGRQLVALADALRSALGPAAFLSIELPTDWETLRSIECRGTRGCSDNLAALARVAYLSLMGYAVHVPSYPGPAITANDSNLFSDPSEPLLAGFDHISLESCPDTSSCRSRQHLPYLGPCKPWGLQGPLGRFAVLRGAALRRVNGHPFAACAAQAHSASPSWLRRMPRVAAMATRATHASHPRASLPALSAVGTSFVQLTLYPGP
jgi:hypothetical protein